MALRGSEKVVEQGLKTILRPSAHICCDLLDKSDMFISRHAIFFFSRGRPLQSDKHSHRQAQDYPPSFPNDELPTLFRQALQEMPLLSISVDVELASPTLPGRLARGLRCLTADRAPQVGRQSTWESLRVAWDISSHDIDRENFYHMMRDMCTPESLEPLHVHEDINPIFTSLIRTVRFPNLKRLSAVLNEDRAGWGVIPVRTLNELIARRCHGLEWLVLDHKHTLREASAPDESLMMHPASLADLDIDVDHEDMAVMLEKDFERLTHLAVTLRQGTLIDGIKFQGYSCSGANMQIHKWYILCATFPFSLLVY
ncbi:uncharacterized protein FPRO_05867 [Fusarium proliferatum ET1]|uniref:Uncharacterized protein n=1 Tax=Fusarium proliferatum (strain ET1) TaxID=1227346 RepID=A0A1L7VE77_FUSPR|nr:uncharacterized protein FPRO_05867 [Fusarium proliferatum ET1]CZR38941.1 uncharacterized protein FPRO_05867 [Fusarium proliferatum ET1]